MTRSILLLIVASLLGISPARGDMQRGGLVFLPHCPGDTVETLRSGDEAWLPALLTPLLTGAISSGLKLVGERFKEETTEAQVDILHKGAHFYTWRKSEAQGNPETWDVSAWCVVLASKQTDATRVSVSELVAGYDKYAVAVSDDGTRSLSSPSSGADELVGELGKLGFTGQVTPGLVLVLDVELSAQKSEFRLVPRFAVMDHSIREERVDSRERDMTFEFSYTVPGNKDAVAQGLLKLEGLVIGKPFDQDIASHWMPLPSLNESEKTRLSSRETLASQVATHGAAAELAGAAAISLGANDWADPATGANWQPVEPDYSCPPLEGIRGNWVKAHQLLQQESTKPKPEPVVVARWTNTVTYFDSCSKRQSGSKKLTDSKPTIDAEARAYDLTIAIKEFRERPVAKFFGDLLTDSDVNEGLTSAIVGAIDPATREATAKKAAAEQVALLKLYEDAVLAAEKSVLEYESAKPEERAAKLLQMNYNQRAANRAAEALGITLPYPSAGTWLGT